MGSRKRGWDEMEASEQAPEPTMLEKLRNMWEFSNLMQYIFIFGRAVKIDEDLTIEDLENECLKPEPSTVLSEIGLALLKYVSSHRGLTPEIFDEYTRRQYMAKAPDHNPFGEEEMPNKFTEFDVFTKIRVLVQLSQWTFGNADRMRERMSDTKDSEQVQWRIEEIGYDKDGRYYFVLDDDRLYRRTDPPPPAPPVPKSKPKAKSKKDRAAARASKRRKVEEYDEPADDADGENPAEDGEREPKEEDDGFGGRKWECIAITLADYQSFLQSLKKSRDPDEKELHRRITDEVLPVIEKAEESRLRKKQKQERELLNLQKLATAKRSSRLEAKQERERQEQEAAEAERKRKADLVAAKQDQEKQKKMEEARESRMMTREQRIKEREYKRILHEEELANLSEENKKVEAGEARLSERHLKTEMEKKKKELAALAEDDEWFFDCSKCGVHGTNLDDGSHSVACDKCNVWQHSACLGISQPEAEQEDFHFICYDCRRREEDAKKPKIPSLKFHIGSSTSPPSQKPKVAVPETNGTKKCIVSEEPSRLPPTKSFKAVDSGRQFQSPHSRTALNGYGGHRGTHATVTSGPNLSPQVQVPRSIYADNQEENFFSKKSSTESNQPPPGFRSPPGPMSNINGYSQQINNKNSNSYTTNTYAPQIPPPSFQASYSGNSHYGSHQPQNVGWSARYTPPQQGHAQQAHGPPPPSQNPFANSFDRQRPSSSHSVHNAPSPVKNAPSLSPPQQHPSMYSAPPYQTPHSNHTSYANGISSHQPLPTTGPPAYSPTKQRSPPSTALPPKQSPFSSPVAHQPPLHSNTQTSPGFSPTKHSPPHQQLPPGHGIPNTPAVLPPAPQLSPSPIQQTFIPEKMAGTNGNATEYRNT